MSTFLLTQESQNSFNTSPKMQVKMKNYQQVAVPEFKSLLANDMLSRNQ